MSQRSNVLRENDWPIDAPQPAGQSAAPATTLPDGIDQSLLPVYQQRWWLDIARGTAKYREAVVFKHGILVGSLPYIVKRNKLGLMWGASADWSHLGGPVVSQALSEPEKISVLRELIAQLPWYMNYGFRCSPDAADKDLIRQAFQAAGFAHFTERTYSQAPDDPDVFTRLNRKHRLHLKSAAKVLQVIEIEEDEFIQFYSVNLGEAAVTSPERLDTARALIAEGRRRTSPQIRVFAARQQSNGAPLDAAVACAWDNRRYYFWMSTRRRHTDGSPHPKPHPDAIKLLIVTAMAHARSLGLVFDADGVSTQGARTLYHQILKIPHEEVRDVFERMSKIAIWYRAGLKQIRTFLTTINDR